jgi:EAL domain-containing protein (putative c-di-GMP-specific phosphodiesterase class I)
MSAGDEPQASNALRVERDRFVAFAFAAADLLLEIDTAHTIRFATGALRSLTQRSPKEMIGSSVFDLFATEERAMVRILLDSIAKGGRFSPLAVQLANADRSVVVLGGCRIPSERECYHLTFSLPVSVAVDDRDAGRDKETGLLDQDSFMRLATERLAAGRPGKITFLNLNGLDALRARIDGEVAAGFMKVVGRHIRTFSSGGDAAARFADGRFGLLHEEELDLPALGRQISDIAATADPTGGGIKLQSSEIDLAREGISETDAARVLVHAINMFAASTTGEFTIPSLADGLRQILRETVGKIQDLRGDLSARNFELVFQPIVSLRTREIKHYEALARFPESASPASRISFAEQVGLVTEVDLMICERVMRLLTERAASQPGLAIAVNLSGRSVESAIFRDQLDGLIRAYDGLEGRLLFEVTESAVVGRMEDVAAFLQQLRSRGFQVCLDDFGAGAVSFDYLNAFAVDFVKIDGKYVRDLVSGSRDEAFLHAISALCQKLHVGTVAEQVETEAQGAILKTLGINFGQGYLFGRPGPLPTRKFAWASRVDAVRRGAPAP